MKTTQQQKDEFEQEIRTIKAEAPEQLRKALPENVMWNDPTEGNDRPSFPDNTEIYEKILPDNLKEKYQKALKKIMGNIYENGGE